MTQFDIDAEYWRILGREYGIDPEDAKTLYDLWEPNKHVRFGDFVRSVLQQARERAKETT